MFALLVWVGLVLPVGGLVLRNSTQSHAQQQDGTEKAKNKVMHDCLKGKRIVFIGPSTSKMDYMSLAFFAEYGWWPKDEQVFYGAGAWGPNPINEPGVMNSVLPPAATSPVYKAGCITSANEKYFRYSNALFNGHEACDCYEFGAWAGAYDMYNSTENRIYLNGDTMISYFQWFGDIVAPRGTFDVSPLLKQPAAVPTQTCPVGQFSGQWTWSMQMKDFLKNVVAKSKPTHVVMSTAFWPIQPALTQYWNEIADAGVEAIADSGGKILYRNTPQRTDHAYAHVSPRIDMTYFLAKGWKMFPARQVVASYQGAQPSGNVFYDFSHLRPGAEAFLMQSFLQSEVCPGTAVPL